MLAAFAQWLDNAGSVIFWTCIIGALAIDTVAVAMVVGTKSRALVNKWTGPVLITNALLLGGGTALPVAMRMTSVAVMAVAPSMTPSMAPSMAAPGAPAADAEAVSLTTPMGTALTR